MIAIARFQIPSSQGEIFRHSAERALKALSKCEGYLFGDFGQNTDDPQLWALVSGWKNVGSYRRALSNYAVKVDSIPLLAQAIDEPGAFVTG